MYLKQKEKKMIRHYIDEKAGVVVAVADGCEDDAIVRIVKRMQGSISEDDKDLQRLAKMHKKYVAVAKCHAGDTFSKQKGLDIADEKLHKKLSDATERAVKRWVKHHSALMKML